jgi:transposase
MDTIYERVGALDVHKAQVTACVRVPDAAGRREPHLAEFSTTVAGALEDTGIKLDCVATDILGASGRAMLDALVAGTTDPEVLADLAKGRLRAKIPALREALMGRFEPHHALVIGAILAHLDFLDEQISRLSDAIEEQLGPFAAGVKLAQSLTGVARRTAE